ncbi:aminoglycoside phosphotransferase family protein [Kribbella sandramycini]|uniref:phosphotransferase family protein n=1 Tax=Kribbella sandramycini TaxID=60450 RepID=UPI00307FD6E6
MGVPVPVVLAVTGQYLLTAEVAGAPSDAPGVLAQAVRHLRRLHELQAPNADWPGRLDLLIDELDVLVDHLGTALIDQLRQLLRPFVDEVAAAPPSLLHADLHTRHLYAADGRLTAILDWGDACYGDPLYDLARLTMTADPATVLTAYGLHPTLDLARTLSRYRLVWSLSALHSEHAAGGAWFAPHVERIRRELVS